MSSRRSGTSHKASTVVPLASSCAVSTSSSISSSSGTVTSSSKRPRTSDHLRKSSNSSSGGSLMRKKSRSEERTYGSHRESRTESKRPTKQRRVLAPRLDSESEFGSESDSDEELPTGKLSLHERFGSLPPPPDMFEERQRDVEVEKVRKRATTSFAITMNQFSSPEQESHQTSSERFGRIQAATAKKAATMTYEDLTFSVRTRNGEYEEPEVSFQAQSLQQFNDLSADDLADPHLYDQYLALQQLPLQDFQIPLRSQLLTSQSHQPQHQRHQQQHQQQSQPSQSQRSQNTHQRAQQHNQTNTPPSQQLQQQRFSANNSNNQMNDNYNNAKPTQQHANFQSQPPPLPQPSIQKVPINAGSQLRLDPNQTIYQNPNMLQGFVNAMHAVRPLDTTNALRDHTPRDNNVFHDNNSLRNARDFRDGGNRDSRDNANGMREQRSNGRRRSRDRARDSMRGSKDGYDEANVSRPRRDDPPPEEFDLLAMGEPTNQPWQLRQSMLPGDKDGVSAAGRTFGGRRNREPRGKPKVNEQTGDARGGGSDMPPTFISPLSALGPPPARPPLPPVPPQPRTFRPLMPPLNAISRALPGSASLGPPPLMPMRPNQLPPPLPGPLVNMRPEHRIPGLPGPHQRPPPPLMPSMGGHHPLQNMQHNPHMHMGLPPRPMPLGPPQPMHHLGGPPSLQQPNPRHMGLLGQPAIPRMPLGGPMQQQHVRAFPHMGNPPPQHRPPMGSPQVNMRLQQSVQGLPARPALPVQSKALVPPGGWAHLPSKVVGAHAPRGAGGARRSKQGRPQAEPKTALDLNADLDHYHSEGLKENTEATERGEVRAEEDEIDVPAPAEEDLGDIGVLE